MESDFEHGLQALRNRNKRRARRLFGRVVHDEPDNYAAWWYLAALATDLEQKKQCLRQVIRLKPDHEEARTMLRELESSVVTATPAYGFKRPILDADSTGEGAFEIPTSEHDIEDAHDGSRASPSKRGIVLGILGAAGMTLIVVMIGVASRAMTEQLNPTIEVAPEGLIFDVQACTISEDGRTSLDFVNQTTYNLVIGIGPRGDEDEISGIDAGGAFRYEVDQAGVPLRFFAAGGDSTPVEGGAIIEVAEGNQCMVPIRRE